jgi:ubiquinone/menaquinone biosynthesis C-methylase UbiE
MNPIRAFIAANVRASRALERRLPQARERMQLRYEEEVARRMNERPRLVVVDVGGGRTCHFAKYREPALETRIVAVDVSPEELELNEDVDEKRVADATLDLPFGDGEVDLLVSRSVIEHLPDTDAFFRNCARVLKPGGLTMHVFPSKFSPHALLNQALPHGIAKRVVHTVFPESKGILGFRAYYDGTYADEVVRRLQAHGLEVVDVEVDYYQSEYYSFLLPAYVASAAYELIVRALGFRNLAAAVLVVARKPGFQVES